MSEANSRVLSSSDFHALAQEVLGRGGSFRFQAGGSSMHPFIRGGDVLLVEPVAPARLRPGEIIFYHRGGTSHMVHRLVRRVEKDGRLMFIAQGDNVVGADAPILAEQVLGMVVEIQRDGRRMRLGTGLGRLLNLSVYRLAPWRPWHRSWVIRLGRMPWRCVQRFTWRKT